MSKKFYLLSLLTASALGLHAQSVDTTRSSVLDEVVVTANKLPQKQSTTGKVISVITKEQIEQNSGRTLPQLLNEQAGLTINGALNNMGSNQTVYMRGASSGRTLILVDGIPISDPSFIQNDFDINLFSLNNIERIEISRGAQSTLYGSDAVAGVINIITLKKDITKPVHVAATVAAGNYGTFRGNLQLFGKLGKFTYTTRYAKMLTNGFSSAHDSTGKANFDNDGYNSDVFNTSVQYQANENLSFRTFIQESRYKTDLDAGLFTDERDYTTNSKLLMTGAGFHFRKNIVSITGNYQYSENRRNYLNDSVHIAGFSTYSTDNFNGRSQFAELYSSIELSKNVTFLQGADYRFNSMNSHFYSLSGWGPYESSFSDTSVSQSSLYGSLLVRDNSQKLNIEVGARLNVHSRYGSNHTFTFNPSYSITNQFRVFGSIATGFKAPTLYQLYSSFGVRDLKPERSTNYELGLQHQHEVANSRIVYFHRDIKDGIDFNNFNFRYYNFISQKVNGVELETVVRPTTALTLSANYTYLNPEEVSQSRVTFKDTTYSHLLRRPKHNLNIAAGYQFTKALHVRVAGKYVGSRFDAGGYQANDIKLDSYFLLNAYAEYKLRDTWTFFLDAQNITNTRFFDIRGYNSIPTLVTGGVTFKL
ncbi:TonB-dependent receptor plug domain-containing protein [Aridibaculum aurantiacum]|uniref:TonB-dependent receptor plug domain-containing protein n=1 Tax=Aridibaculum aurantiacum TaxID=2810307 RepID=UPI001A969E3D|nr:TonB-dependent receptor [Aridibaculum aurantiacum]